MSILKQFNLRELTTTDIEVAFNNAGYSLKNEQHQGGVETCKFSHTYRSDMFDRVFAYACVWIDDGSFEDDDTRQGFAYVYVDQKDGMVKAEW